jgi:hypothetical protein
MTEKQPPTKCTSTTIFRPSILQSWEMESFIPTSTLHVAHITLTPLAQHGSVANSLWTSSPPGFKLLHHTLN